MKQTQAERVLGYIEKFGSITPLEAMQDLGVMRLSARIADLKKLGYPIVSETVGVMNRFEETCHVKRYSMGGADK